MFSDSDISGYLVIKYVNRLLESSDDPYAREVGDQKGMWFVFEIYRIDCSMKVLETSKGFQVHVTSVQRASNVTWFLRHGHSIKPRDKEKWSITTTPLVQKYQQLIHGPCLINKMQTDSVNPVYLLPPLVLSITKPPTKYEQWMVIAWLHIWCER